MNCFNLKAQLGCYTGDYVVIRNENKEAKFHKARPVSYPLQTIVESALLKMEKYGVIKRTSSAVCAVLPLLLRQKGR